MGLPGLWSPITLRVDLRSRRGLKQGCSSRRELSHAVSHFRIGHREEVDSWLFVVGSQIGSSTPGPSFGHNLCFRCLNEPSEPILDIYASRAFYWYKERHNPLGFDPCNCSLKSRKSTGTPLPKVGVALGVWGFTPSHFLTLPGVCDVTLGLLLALTPRLPLGPHSCNAFALTLGLPSSWPVTLQPRLALVVSPKLGLRQWNPLTHFPTTLPKLVKVATNLLASY